jgi:hypothetical protein
MHRPAHNQRERKMDFIEQIFGISPDNGDGSFEILVVVAVLAVAAALFAWRRHRVHSRAARRRGL